MRALHVINGEFFAGAERVQDLLAMRLPDLGTTVEFVCLKSGEFSKKRQSTSPLSISEMRSKLDINVAIKIAEESRGKKFDLVHAHTPRSALIGRSVAKRLNLPLVYHVHSPARRDTESSIRNWINGTIEENLILPYATRIIAVSASLRDYLEERGVSRKRVTVIPNGVPIVGDQPEWTPPKGEWVIGATALFRPRKGVDVLLRALAILIERGLPVRAKLIGAFESQAYERATRQLAADLNIDAQVEWCGFTAHVLREMREVSLFVLPSLYGEGMPMVLLEAMSIGLPVVASNIEGVPQVLQDGIGSLVPPGDAGALADAIQRVVSEPSTASKMAKLSLARHRERYSDVAMAESVDLLYRSAVRSAATQ